MRMFFAPDNGADFRLAAPKPEEKKPEGDPKPEEKKYSDKEVNDIIAGKQDDKVKKLLKELGLESAGSLKENLAKLKEYEDKTKSAEEKSTEALKTTEARATKAEQERDEALATVAAIRAGVSPERADKLVKIALAGGYSGESLADKVAAALKDFPEFKSEGAPTAPKAGAQVKSQSTSTQDKANEAFRKAMGLS